MDQSLIMASGSITITDIRAALERVLASERFKLSPQLSAFLSYVVDKAVVGHAHAIKGYTIATEVFGRSTDFDPQADPIVRVEARRLRQLLAAYYEGPGCDDDIAIELPLGGYVPRFVRRKADKEVAGPEAEESAEAAKANSPDAAAADAAPAPATDREAPSRETASLATSLAPEPVSPENVASIVRRRSIWPLLFTMLAGLAVGLAVFLSPILLPFRSDLAQSTRRVSSPAPFKGDLHAPVVAIMPFRVMGTPPAGDDTAMRLTERLQDALARFDEVRVVLEDGNKAGGLRAPPATMLYPDYRLDGRLIWRAGQQPSIALTLVDVPTSEVLFAWEFDDVILETRGNAGAGPGAVKEDDMVRAIVSQLAQPYGMMFARWTSYASYSRSARTSCLFSTFEFWRGTLPESTARLRPCLEGTISRGEATPGIFALMAMVEVVDASAGRPGVKDPKLDYALALAKRAAALAPTSARAHQILMNVRFFRGETPQAMEAGRHAAELNPYDTDVLADYGARLIQCGRYEEGLNRLRQAVQFTTVRPPRQDFYLFLGALMLEDRAAAVEYAGSISDADSIYGRIARTIGAVEREDPAAARRELALLVALLPGLADDPRGVLARWRFTPVILDRLVQGLRAAGLDDFKQKKS